MEMEGLPLRRSTATSLVLLLLVLLHSTASASMKFIETSCKATRYRSLCVKSLSIYESVIKDSPNRMAQTALTVSLNQARSTSKYVSQLSARSRGLKPRERAAVKDCLDNVGDSVYELERSVRELSRTGRRGSAKFRWQVSNVQTWTSAAITDYYTCVDGLSVTGGTNAELKAALRRRVVHVARVTSNALALVNRYANGA